MKLKAFPGIRVEWLKARARSHRWREELILLEEEMRRSIEFCWWKAKWWVEQGDQHHHQATPHLLEGLKAYASQQANAERQRAVKWERQWHAIRARAQVVVNGQLDSIPDQAPISELIVELEETDDRDQDEELEETT